MVEQCGWEWVGAIGWWLSLTPNEQAAWVQALGTLIALFLAIAVPATQEILRRRDTEKDRLNRARSMAFRMRPWFVSARAKFSGEISGWTDDLQRSMDTIGRAGANIYNASDLMGPATELLDEYHWFGEDAPKLHAVFSARRQLSEALQFYDSGRGMPPNELILQEAAHLFVAAHANLAKAFKEAIDVLTRYESAT